MGNDRARVGHARRGKKLRPDREFPAVGPLAAVAAAAAAPLLDCRVVDLARSAACVWTLGIAACYPTPDPPWLVTRTELIALRLEVTREGELSEPVAATPPDRIRTEMLPGDTARIRPFVVGPDRVWESDELDVAYFACFASLCPGLLHEPAADVPCGTRLDPATPVCSVGRGPDAELVMPSEPLELVSFGAPQLFGIAGAPGLSDTDTCIAAVRARPFGDLSDCMLVERTVSVGPSWVLQLLQSEQEGTDTSGGDSDTGTDDGTSTGDTDGGYTPPPEVYLQWPNFNPEVERFTVVITRGTAERTIDAAPSDRLSVRAGDRVLILLVQDPRDSQAPAVLLEPDGDIIRRFERPLARWYANAPLDERSAGLDALSWTMPHGVAEVRIDALLDDGYGGLAWGSLHFEVDDTSG